MTHRMREQVLSQAANRVTGRAVQRFDLRSHLSHLFGTDLTLIPGIGASTALILFAEPGPDLIRFPTAAQFASWLNLSPHNQVTRGKIINSHTGPGTKSGRPGAALGNHPVVSTAPNRPRPSTSAACGRAWVSAGDHCDRAQTGADHLPSDHPSRGLRRQHPRCRGAPRPATL